MKCHFVKAMIERDPVEHIPVCVLATEIPVLQMVHKGKLSGVEVQDDFVEIDAVTEYDRLESSYGVREGVGRSYAEEVYGSSHGLERRMFIGDAEGDVPAGDDGSDSDNQGFDDADIFGAGNGDIPAAKQPAGRRKNSGS